MPRIPMYIAQGKIPDRVADPEAAGLPFQAMIRAEEGMQRQGLALQMAGQTVSGAVGRYITHEQARQQKVKEAAQALEHIERSSRLTEALGELGERYASDPDWEGKHERFRQESRKLIDDEVKQIKDPVVSLMIRKDAERLHLHHDLAVRQSASRQRLDAWKAQGLNALEVYEREEARAPDELARQLINSKRQAAVAGMVQAGVIDQVTAQKINQSLDERLAANRVIQEMRVDPAGVLERLQSGRFENLTPERREGLIGAAQRQIDARQRQAEADLRRTVIEEERQERRSERTLRETQRANFSKLAAGQTTGKATLADIDQALNNRQIDEAHYRQLLDRHSRDMEREINEGEQHLDQTFRTKGAMEMLDPANEQYRARLKRELRERVRAGEMPGSVLDSILFREQKTPQSPSAYPTPMFLDGKKDDLAALERAKQATAEKFQQGLIDRATAKREMLNLDRLAEAVRARSKPAEGAKDERKSKSSRFIN